MTLRKAGFFAELRHGDPEGPRLSELVRESGPGDENKLASYLEDGLLLVGTPGIGRDVLDPKAPPIDPPHRLTDGIWVWPADLAYYVRKYHVELPGELVEHIRSRSYDPPNEDEIDVGKLVY